MYIEHLICIFVSGLNGGWSPLFGWVKSMISRAPARVCLLGDHQDYLGLPVIVAAINIYIEISAERNDSKLFRIDMPDIGKSRMISLDERFDTLEPRDYFGSSLKVLRRYGCKPDFGLDLKVSGAIPISSGASSSSALVTAWINLLLNIYPSELEKTPENLARLAYEAEVLEHGEPGGMMDQFSIAMGNVIHIETTSDYRVIELAKKMDGLILGDSNAPKDTLSVLSHGRKSVSEAIDQIHEYFPDKPINEIKIGDLPELLPLVDEEKQPYLDGAVLNHSYTIEALAEFKKGSPDFERIGSLMNMHHLVLKNNLRLTTERIDSMIEAALEAGALGAKINGSGGGGTIVVLAPGREEEVIESIKQVGGKAYKVNVDSGAEVSGGIADA